MLVECCYRLIPHGEVIHTKYDDESMEMIGLPKEFFDIKVHELPKYDTAVYREYKRDLDKYVEAMLLSHEDNAIAVDYQNQSCLVQTFKGYCNYIYDGMEYSREDFRWAESYIPNKDNFVGVGFRPTKMLQKRFADKVYYLTYNKATGLFHTNDGLLIPEFDVSSLSDMSYNYAGYKDCVLKGHYAVVYQGGQPVFLDKTPDNKLIIV